MLSAEDSQVAGLFISLVAARRATFHTNAINIEAPLG